MALFLTLQAQAQNLFTLKYVVEVKIAKNLLQDEMVQNLLVKPAAAVATIASSNEAIIRIVDPTTETTDYINALEAANLLTKVSENYEFLEDTCLGAQCAGKKKPKFGIPGSSGGPKIGPIDEGGGGGMDILPSTCKKYDLDCTPHQNGEDKPPAKFPKCFKTAHGVVCF